MIKRGQMFINGAPGFIDKIWLFFLYNSSGQRRRCLLKYDPSIFLSSSSYFYIEKNYQENKYFHQIQSGKEKVRNVYNTSENCPKFLFCFYNLFRNQAIYIICPCQTSLLLQHVVACSCIFFFLFLFSDIHF